MIKELLCVSMEVKCQHWSMTTMLHELVNVRQGDNKTMVVHCKRFKNVVDVVEGQWGELHPEKVAKNESDCNDNTKRQTVTDKCNRKFLACVFVHGANGKLHKNCIGELNNMCLSGSDRCPKSVEAAMTHMSHCMDQNRGDKAVDRMQLMQKTMKCWSCQEEGHKADECLNHEKEQPESELKAAEVKWHAQLHIP